jgi:starch synthase
MAHGVTVIASDTGGIPELIRDGVSGLLVPNEEREIAAAFERIDPRLGAAARETVLGGFTEEHMIQSTIAVYERVCSR